MMYGSTSLWRHNCGTTVAQKPSLPYAPASCGFQALLPWHRSTILACDAGRWHLEPWTADYGEEITLATVIFVIGKHEPGVLQHTESRVVYIHEILDSSALCNDAITKLS
jgi:hypothetical protein